MDEQLIAISHTMKDFRFVPTDGDYRGEIEWNDQQGQQHRYMLKPMSELFGAGKPNGVVDPMDDHYEPLFHSIEQSVIMIDGEMDLTDGEIDLAYDALGMNPEGNFRSDPLAHFIQIDVRMNLSLNSYSRDEVRRTFRRLRKSIKLHSSLSGRRGYIDFIRSMVPV